MIDSGCYGKSPPRFAEIRSSAPTHSSSDIRRHSFDRVFQAPQDAPELHFQARRAHHHLEGERTCLCRLPFSRRTEGEICVHLQAWLAAEVKRMDAANADTQAIIRAVKHHYGCSLYIYITAAVVDNIRRAPIFHLDIVALG